MCHDHNRVHSFDRLRTVATYELTFAHDSRHTSDQSQCSLVSEALAIIVVIRSLGLVDRGLFILHVCFLLYDYFSM